MNKYIKMLAVACFCLVGCAHAAERAETAVKATPHQIALEVCLKSLEMDKGFDYKACADKADVDAGRK